MRPPLLLTGGPAAGKTSTSRALAAALTIAAVIDVDDIRHLVVSGHRAPWEGQAGARQQRIGVENACELAQRFLAADIPVVLADVLNPWTADLYRERLPGLVVVRLELDLCRAVTRALQRPQHLTDDQFVDLHLRQRAGDVRVDHVLDVGQLSFAEQVVSVQAIWDDASAAIQ